MYNDTDFYHFIGVTSSATYEEIKAAYRKQALKYHPDMGGSEELMRKLNYVYEVLSDASKRESYDYSRKSFTGSNTSSGRKQASHEQPKQSQSPPKDDYDSAVFVNGIETVDSKGSRMYVRPGDYIYYPIKKKKELFGIEYAVNDLYRVEVDRVFSLKKNKFNRPALFTIDLEGMQQVILLDDFNNNWLNEAGYNKIEQENAYKTTVKWVIALFIVFLYVR